MLGLRFSRLVHAAIASGALVLAACPQGGKGSTDSDTDGATDSSTETTTDDPTDGPPLDPTLPPSPTDPVPPLPPPDPPPADLPPALLTVKLLDPSTLQLSFTEPVAPVDTVNPKRFRLSVAQGYAGSYGGQPSTFIVDAHYYNFEVYCPPEPPPCYYEPPYNYYYCYYGPGCYYEPSAPILATGIAPLDGDPTSIVVTLGVPIRPSLCQTIESINNSGGDNFSAVLHLHYAAGGLSQITDLSGQALPSLGDTWVKHDGSYYVYEGPPFANFNPFLPIPCTIL